MGRCPSDEVAFWQPSPHGFRAIPSGAPFFFRLGAPHKAIAGFGFFARYERVPAWLAWESFGDKNGTRVSFAEMAARIESIRRRPGVRPSRPSQDYKVGCIMISQPVFVSHDLFADFHNGREYERFAGRTITVPHALADQPDPELLDWRAMEVFCG